MISLTDRPGLGPRGAAALPSKYVFLCAWQALRKSSTSQETSVSRSNMVASHGVVGSTHLSTIFDSEPVIATKLLIGVTKNVGRLKVLCRTTSIGSLGSSPV